jgi:hypothetical protein
MLKHVEINVSKVKFNVIEKEILGKKKDMWPVIVERRKNYVLMYMCYYDKN